MKLTTTILTAAAALGFSAFQASASIGTTVDYSHLNVSITVTTNKAEVYQGSDLYHTGSANANIGNKQLLDLFAKYNNIADRSTDPVWKNAMLVIGWDWDNDVLVVDKTGTNILFDATDTGDNLFYFEVEFVTGENYGAATQNYKDADPGYWDVTANMTGYYQLYVDDGVIPYTDLSGVCSDTETWHQAWNSVGEGTAWSDSENAIFPFQGDQYFLDKGYETSAKAVITASGSGKGNNYILWPSWND